MRFYILFSLTFVLILAGAALAGPAGVALSVAALLVAGANLYLAIREFRAALGKIDAEN